MNVLHYCINITNVLVLVLIPEISIATGVAGRPKSFTILINSYLEKN